MKNEITNFAKTLPKSRILRLPLPSAKTKMKRRYTNPILKKGKKITHIPKGSSKAKEEAKQQWYIEYYFEDEHGEMQRQRVRENINRIKDYQEKHEEAEIILASLRNDLARGYNPLDPKANMELARGILSITLEEAIYKYEEYHKSISSKPRTIGTYLTHIKQLQSYLDKNIVVSQIETKHTEEFALYRINDAEDKWSHTTLKNYKRNVSTFFNWLRVEGYTSKNPIHNFNKQIKSFKEIKDVHVPYSDKDCATLMSYLSEHDKFAALFCRMIYFTCLRPKEIKGLKVKNIDLVNNTITIPADVKKVTKNPKPDVIDIDEGFLPHLQALRLETYPQEYFLFGNTKTIIGKSPIGKNTPLNRLTKALKVLKLDNKGYGLYGFKHTSNINKIKDGWGVDEIMKLNRHTTVEQTMVYIRDLNIHTDLKKRKARPI